MRGRVRRDRAERMSECSALTVPQVAAEYGVTRKTVYAWIKLGTLPAVKLPGGDYRFRRRDLDEFDARCRGTNSPAQTTSSDDEEQSGSSPGPTPIRVARDPFRRGQETKPQPASGETNG